MGNQRAYDDVISKMYEMHQVINNQTTHNTTSNNKQTKYNDSYECMHVARYCGVLQGLSSIKRS
ncbi:hypothetical protein HanXRQr2_Chr17g0793841 [Helianthus annuus]|uniref:Uncharacterized protein n=1 Tax=Helianthus annuus TaxID=4232 RepID=A0A9K3DFY2_HELAN|nr:hypothetical protein HanXRQr2_Chr17g0793841 [Helianthus annuus]KAJ0812420.1 hypothetical protein HanPSC8_Chr17g0761821 [Helianthus annuus]